MPSTTSFGSHYQIFFNKIITGYAPPANFNFDILADDPIWENDEKMNSFNGPAEADELQNALNVIKSYYATSEMILMMGMDFNYMNAFQNYENME